MSIYHVWNGTVLTITSDSGTSSMDLKGGQGDTGCRGPQGPPGVVLDEQGNVIVDLSNYYTREEVDLALENVEPEEIDLTGYATVDYVGQTVNNATANLASKEYVDNKEIDLTDYATKDYVSEQIDAVTAGEVELTNYYTKSETNTAITNATSGLATTSYVDSKVNNIDLSGYYTKSEVDNKILEAEINSGGNENIDLSKYALKTDIPSLEGYAKTTDIPDTYTKAEIDAMFANSSSLPSGEEVEY